MKIGIDARLYFKTGVGVYVRNLLYYLNKIYTGDNKFYIYLLERDISQVNFQNKNFILRKADFLWHSLTEQIAFLNLLNQDRLNLVHFTYFSFPVFYQKKFIATVHDITPYFFKTGKASTKSRLIYNIKHQVFKFVLKSQIKNASLIITPTKTVKNQIISEFGNVFYDKIVTIYEGVNYEMIKSEENSLLGKRFSDKFFIYVGNFYPHKNLERLIKAFSKISDQSYKLLLIGPKDYFIGRLLNYIRTLKQDRRILFYNTQSVKDLIFFYKNAQALIHPSLSEGFGLPIVEAAYFNLPIIGSNMAVFKEILDDQYLSFNPYNIDDMIEKINDFIEKKPKFSYKNILKRYSFRTMAEQTLKYYEDQLSC